jgi:signal transduction histidine kinase
VRNPLNNITLSIEQMMQDVKDDQLAFYMSIIHRNGRRIGDLISELLNTSHMPEVKLENHHLQGILDDVVAASIDRLTLKHIGLEIAYPDTPVYILADREKLKMALLNIVINAVEAMEEREQGILSLSLQSDEDGCPVLRIRDNGCGISEEHISRLFEPYFTRKRNGVGLGLAFTLNILQAHRAEIDVASTEGQGTTFSISFPPAELLQEQLQSEEAGRLT